MTPRMLGQLAYVFLIESEHVAAGSWPHNDPTFDEMAEAERLQLIADDLFSRAVEGGLPQNAGADDLFGSAPLKIKKGATS